MRFSKQRTLLYTLTILIFCLYAFVDWESAEPQIDNDTETQVDRIISTVPFFEMSPYTFATFAMHDRRIGNMGPESIRILITQGPKKNIYCKFKGHPEVKQYWRNNTKCRRTTECHWACSILNCPIPKGVTVESVDLREDPSSDIFTIPISYRIPEESKVVDYDLQYSICVPLLFGNKYNGKRIVEFMELNRLLGVERVTIYVHMEHLENDVRRVLDYYNQRGFLEMVHFPIPFGNIWYHGQLLTITNCLNRHTGVSKYLAFHDLDEFVIPMKMTSVVPQLDELFTKDVAAIRISTEYIATNDDDAPITLQKSHWGNHLETRLTKCVVRPEMVFEQGIHHTSRVIQDHYSNPSEDGTHLRIFHYKLHGESTEEKRIPTIFGKRLFDQYYNIVKRLQL